MTAAPKYGSLWKLPSWDSLARRTRFPWGEVGISGEGMGMCTWRARRGMGPSTYAGVAEIMSGRAISQQGRATTCKDLVYEGLPRHWEGFGLTHEPV